MKEKELRRSMAVFTIGTVMNLTDLTARQIRYYEDQGLLRPKRSATNRRMYSLENVDRLLEIKDYLSDGLSMNAIRRIYSEKTMEKKQPVAPLTDDDVRRILYQEILNQSGFHPSDKNKI